MESKEDYIILKRLRKARGKSPKTDIFRIKMSNLDMMFYNTIMNRLALKENEGVMFAFNEKTGKSYIFNDGEQCAENYRICKKGSAYRIQSKDLMFRFIKFFNLKTNYKSHEFELTGKVNDFGWYEFIYKQS